MEAFDNTSLRLTIFPLKEYEYSYMNIPNQRVALKNFSKIYQTINVKIKIICLM